MEPTQQDTLAVIERTDLWLACVSDGQADRLEDILTDDFRYTASPKFGATELDKITRPDVQPEGVETVPTRPIHNKKLAFVTSWRKEDGRWRCFDNHLLDELAAAE